MKERPKLPQSPNFRVIKVNSQVEKAYCFLIGLFKKKSFLHFTYVTCVFTFVKKLANQILVRIFLPRDLLKYPQTKHLGVTFDALSNGKKILVIG